MNLLQVSAKMDAAQAVANAINEFLASAAGERAIRSWLPENTPATYGDIYMARARAIGMAKRAARRV